MPQGQRAGAPTLHTSTPEAVQTQKVVDSRSALASGPPGVHTATLTRSQPQGSPDHTHFGCIEGHRYIFQVT